MLKFVPLLVGPNVSKAKPVVFFILVDEPEVTFAVFCLAIVLDAAGSEQGAI